MDRLLSVLVILLTAYLYLLGYVYVYAYYGFFGLNVSELGLGFEEIMVNSAPVLVAATSRFDLVFPIVFVVLLAVFLPPRPKYTEIRWSLFLVLIALLALIFPFAGNLGKWKGEEDLKFLPIVEFEFNENASSQDLKFLDKLLEALGAEIRHLTSSGVAHYGVLTYPNSSAFYLVRIQRDGAPWLFVMQER